MLHPRQVKPTRGHAPLHAEVGPRVVLGCGEVLQPHNNRAAMGRGINPAVEWMVMGGPMVHGVCSRM